MSKPEFNAFGTDAVDSSAAVSEQTLRSIVEQGFFGLPGSLANARAACAELIFARAMIQAQTALLSSRNPKTSGPAD